jgi:hypothetical protein
VDIYALESPTHDKAVSVTRQWMGRTLNIASLHRHTYYIQRGYLRAAGPPVYERAFRETRAREGVRLWEYAILDQTPNEYSFGARMTLMGPPMQVYLLTPGQWLLKY